MMNHDLSGDRMITATKIKSFISSDDIISYAGPFSRMVESLIHPPLMSERWFSNISFDPKVVESLAEHFELDKIRVASTHKCSIRSHQLVLDNGILVALTHRDEHTVRQA